MGSKRKSASLIYKTILNNCKNVDTLVDLFCGGFAISEEFLKKGHKVIANDKNKNIVSFIEEVIKGLDESIITQFISKEQFKNILNSPDNFPNWYLGFVLCCWTFGGNQKDYLYGKKTEPIKLLYHNLVINKDAGNLTKVIPKNYINGILKQSTWQKRRIALLKVIKVLGIKDGKKLQHLAFIEKVQQMKRLKHLEELKQNNTPVFFTKSYNEVSIPPGAVVYCDPPYKGRRGYAEGNFNHVEFWDWVRILSKTNKVFVSEYTAPKDFKTILEFKQKSRLQGGIQSHDNQPNECLFTL